MDNSRVVCAVVKMSGVARAQRWRDEEVDKVVQKCGGGMCCDGVRD